MSGFGYNVLGFGANASSAASLPSDDQFNRVSFLSHFDGANNGVNNVFDDSSTSNHTVTAAGNVTQGSFGPFARPDGEWSVDTSGGWTYWGWNSASTGALGDEDFCMECFVFINSFAEKQGIASRNSSGTAISNETWRWEVQTNGTMTMISKNFFGQDAAGLTSSTALTLNTWQHIAAVRQNDTLTFYIDGTARGATSSGSGVFSASDSMWNIGSNGYETANSTPLQGSMSNFRLVVGSAVYTGNFTAPSSKLTAITNTEMLTYQSNRFVDNSADGNSLTTVSSPAVTAFGPFLTSAVYDAAVNGASAYFDGTADALSIAASPISASGNFTLEGWVYPNTTSESGVVGQYQGRSTGRMIITTNAGLLIFFQNGVTGGQATVAPKQWAHFVLQRTGSNIAFYVNGTRILNNSAGNIAQDYLVIGTEDVNSGNYPNTMDGYISNIRITSSAVYSEGTSITVPTAPYTTVTNTNFLLNMADGQAIDSAAQAEWTSTTVANGTPKLQTGQKKIGTSSLYFDGSSNYYFPNGFLPGGTGDFTIEFWFRASNTNNNATILTAGGIYFQFYNNQLWYFPYNGSAKITSSTISTDTWYHVAGVRSGTTFYLFLDGTSQGTLTSVTSAVSTGAGYFGMNGIYPYTGYIDEMRISRMARYTSNFTAPTEPFADKGQ